MAKRGRKPAPTAIKILKGTRADRINQAEPRPAATAAAEVPDPPDQLDAEGAAEWERRAPELVALGVLTPTDHPALALYCSAYSRWCEAQREIRNVGIVTETALGGLKANPAVAIAAAAEATMLRILAEFGCTPSARSRLVAPAEPPADRLGQFLSRRKA